MIVQINNR